MELPASNAKEAALASSKIGSLRVDLGANTAAFEKGIDGASRHLEKFSKKMQAIGSKISGVGKALTIGITAPITAAAAGFGAATQQIAVDAREMANAAKVAGEGFAEFQKQAFAAKSVGIEVSELADIFKDVRERVGEFVVTGGGPLQDAFAALGGKVKLTVGELRGLSGKDALQLIVARMQEAKLSTEEMSFVLESLGSNSTALLPMLLNNAAAMDTLGEKANIISEDDQKKLDAYLTSQSDLSTATEKLTIALLGSGLLDGITSMVEKFAEFTSNLAETNPNLLNAGLAFAAVAAAVGPALVAIGGVVSLAPKVVDGLKAIRGASLFLMANPAILAFAAVVAGIYFAWQNWDKIKPYITAVSDAVSKFWNGTVKPVFDAVADALTGAVKAWVGMHVGAVRALADVAKAVWDWGSGLGTKMADIGRDIIAGIVRGIKAAPGAVWNALRNVVEFGVDKVKDYLGIKSPSLLFIGIGDFMTQGLAIGIRNGGEMVSDAIANVAEGAEIATVRVAETFKQMADNVLGSLRGLASSIKGGDILGILEGVIGLFTTLGGAGVFGAGLQGRINAPVPGFANGTPFHRGGLALVGERGPELVNMNRGASVMTNSELRSMSGVAREMKISVDASPYFDVRVDGRIVQSAPALANAGAAQAGAQAARSGRRRYR